MSETLKGEIIDHNEQKLLIYKYLRARDWIVEPEYTVENRRIDLVAWYRYADIMFIIEVKTNLIAEMANAIGQLQIAKALMMHRFPSYEIHLGLAAPEPEKKGSELVSTICKSASVWFIHNSSGRLFFTYNLSFLNASFESYMAYRLWKVINQKLPRKLDHALKELSEGARLQFEALIEKEAREELKR